MRQAGCTLVLAALVLGLTSAPGFAERNLVPTLERSTDVCPDRPAEIGNCDCATRFPSWDAAEAVFRERHASDERWEMLQASDAYNRRANAARPEAQTICDVAGNW